MTVTTSDVLQLMPAAASNIATNSITAYLDIANGIVTDLELTDSSLADRITKLLAAHFVTVALMPQPKGEQLGNWSAQYITQGGLNLDGSTYGQLAKSLDPTGTLKTRDTAKVKANFRVIGEGDFA